MPTLPNDGSRDLTMVNQVLMSGNEPGVIHHHEAQYREALREANAFPQRLGQLELTTLFQLAI